MKQKPNNCMERIAISATPFGPHFKWETQGNGQALGKVSKEFLLIAVCGNRLRILQRLLQTGRPIRESFHAVRYFHRHFERFAFLRQKQHQQFGRFRHTRISRHDMRLLGRLIPALTFCIRDRLLAF